MSRPLITELPACGPSRGGNHPKTLRGPVGNGETGGTAQSYPRAQCAQPRGWQAAPVVVARGRITTRPAEISV